MKLTGDLKSKVDNAKNKEEAKGIIERAGMLLNDDEVEKVAGGEHTWRDYAQGTYQFYGQYIVYTCAAGDNLAFGICIRFGVTQEQICQWNNLENPYIIKANQRLKIYHTILR